MKKVFKKLTLSYVVLAYCLGRLTASFYLAAKATKRLGKYLRTDWQKARRKLEKSKGT